MPVNEKIPPVSLKIRFVYVLKQASVLFLASQTLLIILLKSKQYNLNEFFLK